MIPFLDLQKITESFQPALDEALLEVVHSGWYLQGQEVRRFEQMFANYCGAAHCVGVANGLDALFLVLAAAKSLYPETWHDGDEVIVPAMTFIATAEAVVRAGLKPVLVDVGADALINPELVEAAITPRTRAIIPVHLYGQTANMAAIVSLARRHGLLVLEDAAQAHGGEGVVASIQSVPDVRHAAAFSFYPGKNLGALGDGGAVVTHNESLARRVRSIANYGAETKYLHAYEGCNSRLGELQAAALRIKLSRLDADNERRREIAAQYSQRIAHPDIRLLACNPCSSVWHIYPIFTPHRHELQSHLRDCGVATLVHYPLPVHLQPCMSSYCRGQYPEAERIAREELSLPISPVMDSAEVERVIAAVNSFKM